MKENEIMLEESDINEDGEVNEEKIGEEVFEISNRALFEEIKMLKEKLSSIDRGMNIASEIKSLCRIIPGADLSLLDEQAFSGLERGESLVYAYLFAEKRARMAEEANEKNKKSSPSSIGDGGSEFYTLEEIKRMDRKTVRKNFERVMKSLEKTHS